LIDELSQEVNQDSRLSYKRQKKELEKRFSNSNLKKKIALKSTIDLEAKINVLK